MAWADDFLAASQTLASALLEAANDPADAIRLLLPLTGWLPLPLPYQGIISSAANVAQDAMAANLRIAACQVLAKSAAAYQPSSYQDASAVRQLVCNALDAEATRAADAGRFATYQALHDLRTAVAIDLAARGAALAWLVEITTAQSMPSLTEAWTLYQDTTREPQLVASADPPHPLFLPIEFAALSR